MPFLSGQTLTASALNLATRKVIARGNRQTTGGSNTGTETGVSRLDDIPLAGGRVYKISTGSVNFDTGVADDEIFCRFRVTTDGSTPTTSSTAIGGGRITADDATHSPIVPIEAYYAPGSDETFSVLLTCQRVNGSGTVSLFSDSTLPIDLVIEDLGEDPGDTGTDI